MASPSVSRASTISTTWAHPSTPGSTTTTLKEALHGAANEIINLVGPKAFLLEKFQDPSQATAFGRWVLEKFPLRDDVLYQIGDNSTALSEHEIGGERPLALHPSYFSFSEDCSVKPAPEVNTSTRLVEGILQDGFLTSAEPVLAFKMVEAWPQTENGVLMRAAGAMSLGSGSVLPLFPSARARARRGS